MRSEAKNLIKKGIKNHVRASKWLVARKNHITYLTILRKNDVTHKKRAKFLSTRQLSSRKLLVAADFFFANIVVTKK
jgi:hypothetical protein